MLWLIFYLLVGVVLVLHAGLQERLIIQRVGQRRAGRFQRDWVTGVAEIAFLALLWPVKLGHWLWVRYGKKETT